MNKRKDLPQSQLYNSIYAPVQICKKSFSFPGNEAKSQIIIDDFLKEEAKTLKKELHGYQGRLIRILTYLWANTFAQLGEEWAFLTILGIIVALLSYMIDHASGICNNARLWLYHDFSETTWLLRYFLWILIPIILIMFGVGFVNLLAPKAAGSGIPEIKTILRGFDVDDFLTFRTLIAKIVGLICLLGSNLPLGKEGPLIHIATIIAALMSKFMSGFQGIYQNESRKREMLGAACAVGVACCFAAPIGGVLLSVEITTSYFAVRNYWRGFCAAIWATVVYRLLYVWIDGFESVTVVYKTSIFVDTPFAAQELLAFSILGIICGFGAAFYMKLHRTYARYQNKNRGVISYIRRFNFFIYPACVCWAVTSATYPVGIGKYLAGHLPATQQVTNLFSNFTWTNTNSLNVIQYDIINNWQTKYTGIYLHLICYITFNFLASIIATTIPVPNGCFGPSFRMGAASGRILGELMHSWYPTGLSYHGRTTAIMPGGYAIVGAAAFSGAVTQTMSVCVIILEMTGQITHVVPILMAVLIANCIAQLLGPSMYNSVIKVKKLPYLPDLLPSSCAIYNIYVEDFMISSNFKYIWNGISLNELKDILINNKKLHSLPLVNNCVDMILLGSIQRLELIRVIETIVFARKYDQFNYEKTTVKVKDKLCTGSDAALEFTVNPAYLKPKTTTTIENEQLWQGQVKVNFDDCQIDPAPFQLVERTSLLKVHSLFSMVGINVAYVTSLGKLVGVVGLKELRNVIDAVNTSK